jgi:transcriptional regulator with XRE-family HTH domain
MKSLTRQTQFISREEIEAELRVRYPGLDRLVAAITRRKRGLRALGSWRGATTQAAVAERVGTSQSAIARLEQGQVDPKLSTLERYAAALQANFVWAIVDDEGHLVSTEFAWDAQAARGDV